MQKPLSDHDLARLHAKFVVPIVVDQMLTEQEPLDDVAEHAIHEIMFELCPDTALLCLAMCARHIARQTETLAAGKALKIQSEQIIHEYGPLWLAHENDPAGLNDAMVREMLSFIPEDLEAMRDLLEATLAGLEEDHCIAAILCDIFAFQADHHRELAETELAHIKIRPQSRSTVELAREHGGNVIAFPLTARRPGRQFVRN